MIKEKTIKTKFCKAKEIICLDANAPIHVEYLKQYEQRGNAWYGLDSTICFWKDGKYAEITKTRKCGCGKSKTKK